MNFIQQVKLEIKKYIRLDQLNKKGFTLIELIIAILIIGIFASVGVPRFLQIGIPEIERFILRLNDLVIAGAQIAQSTNKVQKVLFNIAGRKVELFDIDSKLPKRSIDIPESLKVDDFFINGKSQFTQGIGTKFTAYFLINPQGVTQDTKLIIVDQNLSNQDPKIGRYELSLNPFTAQFGFT